MQETNRYPSQPLVDRLATDHRNMFALLEVLEGEISQYEGDTSASLSIASDIMYYMTRYPDLFHHPREELLFERLAATDPPVRRLINELNYEHRVLAESAADLHELICRLVTENGNEQNLLAAKTRGYANMLRDHMRKEESGVLPLARVLLDDADCMVLGHELSLPADPLFGDRIEQGFLDLRKYLLSSDKVGRLRPV